MNRRRPGTAASMPRDPRTADGDWTDTEAEGQPALEDQPPGIGPDTAEEGAFPPGDGSGPSLDHGVTGEEQARPESVRRRTGREQPEGLDPLDDPDTAPIVRLVGTGSDEPVYQAGEAGGGQLTGGWRDDDVGLSAEKAAVHVTDE